METGFIRTFQNLGGAANRIALWALCLIAGGAVGNAYATEVQVVGLFSGKALVVIDGGKPRTLAVGQSVGAVKLVSATSEAAVIEVDGKRRTLTTGGQTSFSAGGAKSSKPTVTIAADLGGHYYAEGAINGIPMRFLVDTGATMVSLGQSDARRLGINYLQGERGYSNTANGAAVVYRVKFNTVKVGSITLNNVDGLVHESADMPFALLGMSFLNRLELKHDREQLTMVQRY